METKTGRDNMSYIGSVSSYEGTIAGDPSIPYYAKVMGKDTERYPTNTKKEQHTESKKYVNVNIDVHANSKAVSTCICNHWLLLLCGKRKFGNKNFSLNIHVLQGFFRDPDL